jgi:hypothetical protein
MLGLNVVMTFGAVILASGRCPSSSIFWFSIKGGKKIESDNPWDATTLEWATPTPPPHGNFPSSRRHRGPYEYSVPGSDRLLPAVGGSEPGKARTPAAVTETAWLTINSRQLRTANRTSLVMDIPYTVTARPDTGLYNAKVGIWLFLASEVMLFGGLFSAYIFLRVGADYPLAGS